VEREQARAGARLDDQAVEALVGVVQPAVIDRCGSRGTMEVGVRRIQLARERAAGGRVSLRRAASREPFDGPDDRQQLVDVGARQRSDGEAALLAVLGPEDVALLLETL
jgi:hypothetical protein